MTESDKLIEFGQEDKLSSTLDETNLIKAKELSRTIDVENGQSVLAFGVAPQKELGEFSQAMIDKVNGSAIGVIGDSLNELSESLNGADPSELVASPNNFFTKIFGKMKKSIYETTLKYQTIGAKIDKISIKLEKNRDRLISDNLMLESLYEKNKEYFQELNLYIVAGELKIDELEQVIIPGVTRFANTSDNQMDAQLVQDYIQFLDRLDKRVYDLKLSRQISIEQAAQIRLIQNTNQTLAEKIQASIHTAIPLWKNQVIIALTLLRQKDAVTAQRQVSETTNMLLSKNSEMLKVSSIETAKENERGIVEIETLKKTQSDLVETIQETLRIQSESSNARKLAQIELDKLELDLKKNLLELTHSESNVIR